MAYTHDVCYGRKYNDKKTGEEKTAWSKCGAAFTNDRGQITVVLDATPVPVDGKIMLSLFEPKPRDGQAPNGGNGGQQQQPAAQSQSPAAQGDIPF